MKLNERIFGIKTKNLSIAEIMIHRREFVNDTRSFDTITNHHMISFKARKYILVRGIEIKYNHDIIYKDIFTDSTYKVYNDHLRQAEVFVRIVCPLVSNQKRIKYKDAENVLDTLNPVLIKKRNNIINIKDSLQ